MTRNILLSTAAALVIALGATAAIANNHGGGHKGQGMGQQMQGETCNGEHQAMETPLTVEGITAHMTENMVARHDGAMKLGKVTDAGDTITVEVLNADGTAHRTIEFDKATGDHAKGGEADCDGSGKGQHKGQGMGKGYGHGHGHGSKN